MYMSREEMAEFLESFADAMEEMFDEAIIDVEWPEVEDELRRLRDEVYNEITDLAEEVKQ